jgi:hypothetical protein
VGVAPLWNKSRAAQHADYYNCTWQVPTRIKNKARSAGKFRRIAVKCADFIGTSSLYRSQTDEFRDRN